ncbi:MAG: nicotinate (nicotinamide) nucleotide adenylyltransferase [Deltaproteobacteria bacterium]|nr:nicotinate (nicotinamide) nucleotide adenylyltransferase [Deltaproteobacteria bacterium]
MNNKKQLPKKIGILGGSFDPVHLGHLDLAQKILKSFHINKVIFVPNFKSPYSVQRKRLTSSKHRLKMLELALKFRDNLNVDNFEIQKGGISYTLSTLKHFHRETHSLYFITGIETFKTISTWHRYKELFKLTHFVVVPRASKTIPKPSHILPQNFFEKNFKKLPHKTVWEHSSGHKIFYKKIKTLNISSSMIREKIKNKKNIVGLIPKEVYRYIEKTNLYQKKTS